MSQVGRRAVVFRPRGCCYRSGVDFHTHGSERAWLAGLGPDAGAGGSRLAEKCWRVCIFLLQVLVCTLVASGAALRGLRARFPPRQAQHDWSDCGRWARRTFLKGEESCGGRARPTAVGTGDIGAALHHTHARAGGVSCIEQRGIYLALSDWLFFHRTIAGFFFQPTVFFSSAPSLGSSCTR